MGSIQDQIEKFKHVAQSCIGLRKEDAVNVIHAALCIPRLISEDGVQFDGSADRQENRINFEVIDGKVRNAYTG